MTTKSRQHDRRTFQELAKLAPELGKVERRQVEAPEENFADDAWQSDSGVLDLAAIPPPGGAPPAASGVQAVRPATPAEEALGKGLPGRRSALWLGLGAVLSLAAVAWLTFSAARRSERSSAASTVAMQGPVPPASVSTSAGPMAGPPDPPGIDPSQLPLAQPSEPRPPGSISARHDVPSTPAVAASDALQAAAPSPSLAVAAATPSPEPRASADAPPNLDTLMRQAVGGASSAAPAPEVGTGPKAPLPGAAGSLPLKPSLGAVQSAVRSEMPVARACLGPDDAALPVTITFRADGAVQSVAFAGGARGSSEACIRTALGHAHAPPFTQATFVFQTTVRPN